MINPARPGDRLLVDDQLHGWAHAPTDRHTLNDSEAPAHILGERTVCRRVSSSKDAAMRSMAVRLLVGAGLLAAAIVFTGILAMGMEQLAEGNRGIDGTYRPPSEPRSWQ